MRAYSFYHIKKGHFLFIKALQLFVCLWSSIAAAQTCPPNIDFENGTFDGWKCYIGSTAVNGSQNVITLYESGPVQGRHTIFDASVINPPDQFGGFPVTCPNGSRYSIRLGNDRSGTEAEGLSYEFTIPANQNFYSLIYHYAVVFQDPSHEQFQQPNSTQGISADVAGMEIFGYLGANLSVGYRFNNYTGVNTDASFGFSATTARNNVRTAVFNSRLLICLFLQHCNFGICRLFITTYFE